MSNFHWENPHARKVMQEASGLICAEIVRDFLEHYHLDYSLSIYMPEANLNQQQVLSKEELQSKIGLPKDEKGPKPVLMQLLEQFMQGAVSSAPMKEEEKREEKLEPLMKKEEEKKG